MAAKRKQLKRKQPRKAKSNSIEKLFVKRANDFNKGTAKILKSISGALSALNERLNLAAIEKAGGQLEWDDISMVRDETRGVLILVGVVSYKPGSELTLDSGEKTTVTKETAPYFRRLVRAGLDVEIAHKSKKQVLAYLQKEDEDAKKETQVAVKKSDPDLDLSVLTEEQRKLLVTSDTSTSKQ